MTEREWWNRKVRKALHRPAEGYVAHKVEDKFKSGQLDVDCAFRGSCLKIELKFVKKGAVDMARAIELLRPSQRVWAEEWVAGGGRTFMLVGCEELEQAYLFDLNEALKDREVRMIFSWSRYESLFATLDRLPAYASAYVRDPGLPEFTM